MIDSLLLDKIASATDIVSLVSQQASLKKSGSRYTCRCPFHADNDASMVIYPATNTFHCFGCNRGSSVFDFVMERDGVPFFEAAEILGKAAGIEVAAAEPPTPQALNAARKREKALATLKMVNNFFVANLERSPKAKNYVRGRWDDGVVAALGIGYALPSWDSLVKFATEKDLDLDLLVELGLIRISEKSDRSYDFFRDRITIPITDTYGNIVGFSCRDVSFAANAAKYMNSPDSFLFTKSELLFGLSFAKRQAIKDKRIYVVEGCPDVIKLYQIGVPNVVAPMGTALSDKQLKQLRRYAEEVVFIPDNDLNGAGQTAVLKNGQAALACGLTTTIKLLPVSETDKVDVDSFIINRIQFSELQEEDFIIYFSQVLFSSARTLPRKAEARKEIAALLKQIQDDSLRKDYINRLVQLGFGDKMQWKLALDRKNKNIHTDDGQIDAEAFHRYGFLQEGNHYYGHNKDGEKVAWSNFIMKPLFHIMDSTNPKRLYEVTNVFGFKILIEMKQEELTSIAKFKTRIEGAGNFIWLVGERELTRLKCYLYDETESALEIKQLGWQKNANFWAWGNGGVENGFFTPANDFGIIKTERGNFYLPATSKIFTNDQELFQFERRFVYRSTTTKCSFSEYADRMVSVYGDNAKIGLLFTLCTLFKDIVVRQTNNFPVLNIFGPKGTGKSALGVSLMSLFLPKNKPINVNNATLAALSDSVAQCANALVHLDEYRNDIDVDKREFLKGLWDGVGRSRMNMDRDKKREITSVDSGIILSGQHMATADIALFSRFIFISFSKTTFSADERTRWAQLNTLCEAGLSGIINDLLRHRNLVEISFHTEYEYAVKTLNSSLAGNTVEDRIFRNWVILLAIYRCLDNQLHFSFTESNLIDVLVDGIKSQSSECSSCNEVSTFWNFLPIMLQMGVIYESSDYRIDIVVDLKTDRSSFSFNGGKKVLYLRNQKVFNDYQVESRRSGQEVLPSYSLKYYLEKSSAFLGYKNSVRFKHIVKGMPQVENSGGSLAQKDIVSRCMVFDYEQLQSEHNITLETLI